MTKEEFDFMIACKKAFEFDYNGASYNLTYGKDDKGEYIAFGKVYQPIYYYSYGDFLNNAKVENHFFREMIKNL